jgi:lysophospholipase L1-like esterase
MSLRETAATTLLLVSGALVAVATAELLLRATKHKGDPGDYFAFRKSEEPRLDYEFVPGVRVPWSNREIRVNAQGFRGPDFATDRRVEPRIAVIGDSIAAGYGVAEEDALPFRMASLMRKEGLQGEVLGFGVPGYNIERIVALWETRVLSYHPSIVVYAMCLNDARPELTLNPEGVLVAAGTIELSPGRARPGRLPIPGKEWLREHSLLYAFTMRRYDLLLRSLGVRQAPLPLLDEVFSLYVSSPEGERFRRLLLRLATSVEKAGGRLLVLCFPTADQLRADDARPQAALANFADSAGIHFLDLFPTYRAKGLGSPNLLFEFDGLHPNALGHHVAAAEVVGVLRSRWGK